MCVSVQCSRYDCMSKVHTVSIVHSGQPGALFAVEI